MDINGVLNLPDKETVSVNVAREQIIEFVVHDICSNPETEDKAASHLHLPVGESFTALVHARKILENAGLLHGYSDIAIKRTQSS